MKVVLKNESERKNCSLEKNLEYANILKELVSCKTVFTPDFKYQEEFNRFNELINKYFSVVTKNSTKLEFGSGCFVYVLKGENATKNVMLMSHHDVVKETPNWKTDAFKGEIIDGYLYGRGSIDTKTPLFSMFQATKELIEEGYDLSKINLYIGSSNNEEVAGDGMVEAVKYFVENNIHFDVILDEGGAILSNMIPGYNGKSAMVAVHEKSRHIYKCEAVEETIGHGGLNPSSDSAILRLNKFINEVSNAKIYKNKFYPEVKETFIAHVPYMQGPMKFVFGNLGLFSPVVKKIMGNMPQAKPMLNTSVIFTTLEAGDLSNPQIKAKKASCNLFLRCIREADLLIGFKKIEQIAKKYDIKLTLVERDYCNPSRFDTKEFNCLKSVLNENFPDVVVAPFLLTAGTDARRFSDCADNILRFAPIDLSKEQFASIHGDNECIKVENIGQCVLFYKDFLKKYGGKNE